MLWRKKEARKYNFTNYTSIARYSRRLVICFCINQRTIASLYDIQVRKLLSHVRHCDSMDYTVHGILQARILEWVAFPFFSVSSNPEIKSRCPALQADSLQADSQEKPKNTGVGSLSLLQRIFPTQESNQGLLHCRRIIYQLSYQGIPP